MLPNLDELISDYILINFTKPITVDGLCKSFFISRTHLHRLFKSVREDRPKEYLTRLRMEFARRLLSKNEMRADELAPLCGYEKVNTFLRAFKSYYGVTFSNYRKLNPPGGSPNTRDR